MKLQNVDSPIIVQSGNVEIGEALTEHARGAILRSASKYFGRLNRATVHFSRDGIGYRCSVQVQMGGLGAASGEARHKDIYRAFDQAHERVSKQLRRAKRELREDKPGGLSKDRLLSEGLGELRRVRDERSRQPQNGRSQPPGPAFNAYIERLLDGEREPSLLFVVEDVARELNVPYATALDWVIEYVDEKLGPRQAPASM
jgi:ribosomal subunit interface protein